MADLPVGAGFGTLVHAVFEAADLTAPDLRAELLRCVHAELDRHRRAGRRPRRAGRRARPVARTPLGPLADGRRLADIAPADRLAELDFELPLAGGDTARRGRPRSGDLVPLLRRHLPAGDPLAGYPDRLAAPGAAAAARLPHRQHRRRPAPAPGPRFAVVDYKTNWLGAGPTPEPLTAAHYTPERARRRRCCARTTRCRRCCTPWRCTGTCAGGCPDYDPARHLGGVLYLFLRGMCGPGTPVVDGVPCGVFSWRPPRRS